MNISKIGKFIASLRKEKKLTQQELADKLFVTDKAVSKWENGRCMPDSSLFEPLCRLFDISVSELLNGEKIEKKLIVDTSEKILIETVDYSNKKIKRIKIVSIIIIITLSLLICVFMFINDYNLILKNNQPNFMFKLYNNNAKTVFIGPGYKMIKYDDTNNIKFGFWFFSWDVSIIDTSPVSLTVINGNNRVLTEIGSYCIKSMKNGIVANTCGDSISLIDFNYKQILDASINDIISINNDFVFISKVSFYDVTNNKPLDIKINNEKHSFTVPNLKGIYFVKLDTFSQRGKCWYAFKISIK